MTNSENTFTSYITKYFRQSLIDSERLSPDVKMLLQAMKKPDSRNITKGKPFSLHRQAWETGQLAEEFTEALFKTVERKVKNISLMIMPRIDLLKVESGLAVGQQSRLMVAIVVEVSVNKEGQLMPSDKPPYVPRQWLAPNHSDQLPFAELRVLDEFMTLNPFTATDWCELQDYCGRLLTALLQGNPGLSMDAEDDSTDYIQALSQENIHPDYELQPELSLALLETPIRANFHMLKVLDTIIKEGETNTLYQRLISPDDVTKDPFVDRTLSLAHSRQHLGQMTGEFPLSPKQRNALHYLQGLDEGEMLAVNGPPGTGKTTLLRSVIADLWVNAALSGDASEPPIIVATSSNNQAVTNILESFAKIDERQIDEKLQGRWLPGLDTYGLYGCSKSHANEKNPFPYSTKQGEGLMAEMEHSDYVKNARVYFLQAFNRWHGSTTDSVKAAAKSLHKKLKASQQQLDRIIECFSHVQTLMEACHTIYGGESACEQRVAELYDQKTALTQKLNSHDDQLNDFLLLWRQRSFWQLLFSFLPPIKNRWYLDNEILARKYGLISKGYSDQAIRNACAELSRSYTKKINTITKELEQAEDMVKQLRQGRLQLDQLFVGAGLSLHASDMTPEALVNALDVGLRFHMFKLATHYWEARWLLEVTQSIPHEKSPTKLRKRHYRYAKLTPCLIGTFNMIPDFFCASAKDGDGWKTIPLINTIDLLIVDEAGQALAPVAAASFLLAKKALLVGDTYQIEPVWSLTAGIDRANLSHHGLLTSERSYDQYWLQSSLLASSGNLMRVGQRQVAQHQFTDLEPGLYLTEHRRCYDTIITFCNQLVYHGHLEPLRGNPETDSALPLMGFVHHESVSQTTGQSRSNLEEAQVIRQWIQSNESLLKSEEELGQALAIITPFAKQANVIQKVLREYGYASIPVGTVHRFQGAERPVVLFSSVYASNDQAIGKFYDRGSNMLNVAVSRARNNFIVFGHRDIFGASGLSTPSGLLMSLLSVSS